MTAASYRCESWTVRKSERRKFDACEQWCWQRLLREDLGQNEESILDEIRPETSPEGVVVKRALTFVMHTV